jgi:plastocyanin
VSRAAARLTCLGLVGALAMAMGSAAHAGDPAAEGCTWQRHAKRVVKQVKRHGRVQRVKRVKRWWTCDHRPPVSAQPAPALPPAPASPGPTNTLPHEEPQPEGTVSHLGVKAVEWSYTLSRPEVTAGKVIVELNNQGEDNHNLKLQREGSGDPPLVVPEAAPDEHTSAGFNLPVGTYRLYCSLFEHDEKGMHATLVVGTTESG